MYHLPDGVSRRRGDIDSQNSIELVDHNCQHQGIAGHLLRCSADQPRVHHLLGYSGNHGFDDASFARASVGGGGGGGGAGGGV